MNAFLRRALLDKKSPYFSVLPYNINWMLSPRDPVASLELKSPIVFVDVGCRGGLPDELWPIRRMICQIGFDADEKECARLSAEEHELHSRSIYPQFIGGSDGRSDFHFYHALGDSSALKPDPRYVKLIGGPKFGIKQTIGIETTCLDSFFSKKPDLALPDIIKLDTQGTELTILKGATRCLETCSLVEVEVEFMPMYEGQPLLHDVAAFMNEKGFQLLHLNRVFSQQRGYQGFAKGQLTFGDALFAKREDCLGQFCEQRLLRFAILLINYGYLDLVWNLINEVSYDSGTKVFLREYLQSRVERWSVRRFRKTVIPWIDKMLALLLYTKKHNALTFDSDRSWPTR